MTLLSFDVFLHLLIGLVASSATWGVARFCTHKGLLPHPRLQIPIVLVLVYIEAVVSVWLVG
jgi:hypothetical protein